MHRCTLRFHGRPCKGQMRTGIVLAPVYGNRNGNIRRGSTIYPVGAKLVKCWKCRNCGHSVAVIPTAGFFTSNRPHPTRYGR